MTSSCAAGERYGSVASNSSCLNKNSFIIVIANFWAFRDTKLINYTHQNINNSTMLYSRIVVLAFFVRQTFAAGGDFSYDPASDKGPANWGSLELEGNQCDGTANSPIAVITTSCDKFADYGLNVSLESSSYSSE